MNPPPFQPPETPRRPVRETLHGVTLEDPYRWLEDGADPEVVAWTDAQHAAATEWLDDLPPPPGLREAIAAVLDRDVTGPPMPRADRTFFYRKARGHAQYALWTRLEDGDRPLFDPLDLDPEGRAAISGVAFSHDAALVAVGVQYRGDEIAEYRVLDSRTGQALAEPLSGLRGFTFCRDARYAYLTRGTREEIERQQPHRTWRARWDRPDEAELVGEPPEPKQIFHVFDARHVPVTVASLGDFYANTLSIKRPEEPASAFRQIWTSRSEKADVVDAVDGALYLRSNEAAPNFRLFRAGLDNPERPFWKEVLPEDPDAVLEDAAVLPEGILARRKRRATSGLDWFPASGEGPLPVPLPETGAVAGLHLHRESGRLYVTISGFLAPARVWTAEAYALPAPDWTLHHEEPAPIDTSALHAEVLHYPSRDGTPVPLFLIRRADAAPDGSHPALLYGYGGFNVGMSPGFVGLAAEFVRRGGVYAVAGIRGGDEYGEAWHRDGMLARKQNGFDDFIAAAEWLMAEGWAHPRRLAIKGGSNGGLLMGAMLTQRPDLFRCVVCAVPLLDMIRYPRFLIARYWIPEYGDPDREEDFRVLLAYSPYHRVREGIDHPPVLVRTGLHDIRVDPMHARKFVARLQGNAAQRHPVLLYADRSSGHGSGKSVPDQILESTREWTWIFHHLGLSAEAPEAPAP